MLEEIKESYEDYLKAILKISKRKKGGWVSNSEIAEFLMVIQDIDTRMEDQRTFPGKELG